jgi:urease accessory protein
MENDMKKIFGLSAFAALIASPALAHHPLAGAPMETFTHGVLSGIGHPLLATAPLGYLAGMVGGIALVSSGIALPAVELVIAASLVVLGGLIASGAVLRAPVVMALFAGAGLFHGWAFGGAIAGQEAGIGGAVLVGYLLGLAVTQYAVAYLAGSLLTKGSETIRPRLAGAVVAGVGATFMLENIEGMAFAALGLV